MKGLPADIPADVVDDLDDIFSQEALWEGDGGTYFTANDCLVVATTLALLPKTLYTSVSEFGNLVRGLVDEVESSWAATAEAAREFERQKELVSSAEKSTNNALHDVASLRGRVAVAGTRETQLLYSASAASSQIERTTA